MEACITKTPFAKLDRQLGDIQTKILSHEKRIIERVAAFVLRFQSCIREPVQILATLDCLLSMAKVAADHGYVRPKLNENNVHEIVDGRHPILELYRSDFVSNNLVSGGPYSHMKIITGPNASGKSIYLKQVALLIYLAHIGSYLPVCKANISMVHSIHSRMHAMESAYLHLSAFMIDLNQMSQALYNSKPTSLILMDEFGRGTTGREGLALLTGSLRKFLKQGEYCPHVLVSTHLEIHNELLDSPLVQYQKMEHTRDGKTNDIVFLYKVIDGVSNSYAVEIAATAELDKEIILRAREILSTEGHIAPLKRIVPAGYDVEGGSITSSFLTNVAMPDIPDIDNLIKLPMS